MNQLVEKVSSYLTKEEYIYVLKNDKLCDPVGFVSFSFSKKPSDKQLRIIVGKYLLNNLDTVVDLLTSYPLERYPTSSRKLSIELERLHSEFNHQTPSQLAMMIKSFILKFHSTSDKILIFARHQHFRVDQVVIPPKIYIMQR